VLPIAEDLAANGIYLSTSPHLSLADCDTIASALLGVLAGSKTIGAAQDA
jgi:dTDP-4-amino-4,6-dideoxygalactose transaminase